MGTFRGPDSVFLKNAFTLQLCHHKRTVSPPPLRPRTVVETRRLTIGFTTRSKPTQSHGKAAGVTFPKVPVSLVLTVG